MRNAAGLGTVGRVYRFWGRHPRLYALQDGVTFMGRPGRIRGAAVDALGLGPGARVLELACGTGRDFPFLERAVGPAGQVVGFDFSQAMLDGAAALCRRKGWSNVELVQGDAAELDLGGPGFDGALCVLGLSAIPRWEEAIARCRAVLRTGGTFVACDARLPTGLLGRLNPWIERVYASWAAWEPGRDIVGRMKAVFGNVNVHVFNRGTFLVARSVKTDS